MKEFNIAIDEAGEVAKLAEANAVEGIPHAFIFKGEEMVWQGHPMTPPCEKMLKKVNRVE